jgi:S-adenosylmethionine:tRNA ribosyltransferase-isomerase
VNSKLAAEKIEHYTYDLPAHLIALVAAEPRDSAKLLRYQDGHISDHVFYELPSLLKASTTLFANNSRVIPARIQIPVGTDDLIEIFLLEPIVPHNYTDALNSLGTNGCTWLCFVGRLKKWKNTQLSLRLQNGETATFERKAIVDNAYEIEIKWSGTSTFSELLSHIGKVPLPPYIKREPTLSDELRYQTAYSTTSGSVAAPTAGLHFTPNVLQQLENRGTTLHQVTLHVGAGTFAPVKSEFLGGHNMHTERFSITLDALKALILAPHVTAVGTTTIRTLESLFWIGIQLHKELEHALHLQQWAPYEFDTTAQQSAQVTLGYVLSYMENHQLTELQCSTQILIGPGYQFKVVNDLITNFHQPNSTLLLLIAALIGDSWKDVYAHALNYGYRFLSYGDSSLLHTNIV